MQRRAWAGLGLAATLLAAPAQAGHVVEQLVKTKFSGSGAVANIFAGKAAKEGLPIRTAIEGDRRATLTNRDVEVIDLGDEMIWRYAVNRKGKPKKCRATTFAEFKESLQALDDLPFGENAEAGAETEGAPQIPEYELTIDFVDLETTETHAGMTGNVYRLEVIAHRPGLGVEEGGGILTTTFVIGPKTDAWDESQAWNQQWAAVMDDMTGFGDNFRKMLLQSPALKELMASLKAKQEEMDGTPLRVSTQLAYVDDPRLREQAAAGDDDGVPTSIEDAGFQLGKSLFKKKEEETSGEPREVFSSDATITELSDETDPLLTLPEKCPR